MRWKHIASVSAYTYIFISFLTLVSYSHITSHPVPGPPNLLRPISLEPGRLFSSQRGLRVEQQGHATTQLCPLWSPVCMQLPKTKSWQQHPPNRPGQSSWLRVLRPHTGTQPRHSLRGHSKVKCCPGTQQLLGQTRAH